MTRVNRPSVIRQWCHIGTFKVFLSRAKIIEKKLKSKKTFVPIMSKSQKFYECNLQVFVIFQNVCPLQDSTVKSNVCE